MPLTVYLCEKPSQANDIASVLGIKRKGDGLIELKNGDIVTNARGHMYELVEPKEYDPKWGGSWSWSQLPLIPDAFKMVANKKTASQLKIIRECLKKADAVVIATDAGREGELIAREILEQARYKGPIKRFWTSSLTPKDIERALKNLKDGKDTYPLYEAALARSHCDWTHGLTLTRAATLAARVSGDYYPVGRVQTPTLAMVVRRDEAIKNFKAATYYELEATVRTAKGESFKMFHAPTEEHRITDKAVAQALVAKAEKAVRPVKVEKTAGKESPPMPFALPGLQKEANRVLGISAKRTLELAQKLYEKKASTYPRTDCQFLAESQKEEVGDTLANLNRMFPAQVAKLKALGVVTRASTFNDAKLVDHHGIIPTMLSVELDADELGLFKLIAQRYLQTLGPDCLFEQTKLLLDANGVPFRATGRVVTAPGWTDIKLV